MDKKEKLKDGVSVKEIEGFAKKHKFEVFFCLMFVLSCFFSFVFFGTGWSVVFGAIGGVIGSVIPARTDRFANWVFGFVARQERVTQMVLGAVMLVFSIFLPFIVFLLMGLHAGKSMQEHVRPNFHRKDKG